MPIGSVIQQPASESITATYRPVSLRVTATKTDGTSTPPVVYCDIYFNNIFYKTLSKTQYTKLNNGNTEWEFDIQDAGQEYLGKFLARVGETTIVEAPPLVAKVLCKFRASGIDSNGFIVYEGTAPVQGTSSTPPSPGTGTVSNEFYIVNATLQHKDAQSLGAHLFYLKKGTWSLATAPLTHRPDNYRINLNQHDMFPIIYSGLGGFGKLRLKYRYCGQTTFHSSELNIGGGVSPTCTALLSDPHYTPLEFSGYQIMWTVLSGSPAYFLVSSPGWNDDEPRVRFDEFILVTGLGPGDHVFTIRPVCEIAGETYIGAPKSVTIHVEGEVECTPASWVELPALPDATVGVPYYFELALTGTTPFTISNIVKPSWLSINLSGSLVTLLGTPAEGDVSGSVTIQFDIESCTNAVLPFTDNIAVAEAPGSFLIDGRYSSTLGAVCSAPWLPYYLALPDTAIAPGVSVYADSGLTTLLGDGYYSNPSGEIFTINSGVIGSSTGTIC